MDHFPAWPQPLRQYIGEVYGSPTAVERLDGMSQGAVYRVRLPDASVIVKTSPGPHETRFYTTIAAGLRECGVPCPALEWTGAAAGVYWMILEDIRLPFPRERWQADPEQLTVLGRLHTATLAHPPAPSDVFQPAWTDEVTTAALSCFPQAVAAEIGPPLHALQARHQYLFQPHCPISGDPNPANWGVRDDGTLVLFDWERFGYGTPPLDLAISIPGMGDRAAFAQVAARYLEQLGLAAPATSRQQLAYDIGIAKVWNVVEFLTFYAAGELARSAKIDALIDSFPAWLRNTYTI